MRGIGGFVGVEERVEDVLGGDTGPPGRLGLHKHGEAGAWGEGERSEVCVRAVGRVVGCGRAAELGEAERAVRSVVRRG